MTDNNDTTRREDPPRIIARNAKGHFSKGHGGRLPGNIVRSATGQFAKSDNASPQRVSKSSGPAHMLKRLYEQFEQQVEEFEKHVTTRTSRERDAKSLGALAATLDRLHALEKEMKKKNATTEHNGSRFDRDGAIRKLCDRLEKLVRAADVERKDQRPSEQSDKR